MTLIEIFDKTPVENIITTLAFKPDRVVFVGSDQRKIYREIELYKTVLAGRGIKSEMSVRAVPKNNLDGIVRGLYDIVSDPDEDYVVDFSGGDESSLVAIGMILGDPKLKAKRIYAFRINAISRHGVLFEAVYGEDGERRIERETYDFSSGTQVYLTAEENITIHGGRVFGRGIRISRGDEVCRDIDVMWEMCRKNPVEWNAEINTFSAETASYSEGGLYLIPRDSIGGGRDRVKSEIWETSVKEGLVIIDEEKSTTSAVVFKYKNKIVEECLSKSGSVLEYYTYKTALEAEKDGEPLFDDAEIGIIIGWDNDPSGTRNEIDVMLMRGMLPVFISCKNGDIKSDELYKLETVAKQFGGDYSEKALVSSAFFDPTSRVYAGDKGASNFRDRAGDMGVRLISMVHKRDADALKKDILRLI